jgi:hypothetical protein
MANKPAALATGLARASARARYETYSAAGTSKATSVMNTPTVTTLRVVSVTVRRRTNRKPAVRVIMLEPIRSKPDPYAWIQL